MVYLFDTESRTEVDILQHEAEVSQLTTVSDDGTALLWRIDIADLVKFAYHNIVSRDLTNEERETYFRDTEPYRPTCPNLPAAESTTVTSGDDS